MGSPSFGTPPATTPLLKATSSSNDRKTQVSLLALGGGGEWEIFYDVPGARYKGSCSQPFNRIIETSGSPRSKLPETASEHGVTTKIAASILSCFPKSNDYRFSHFLLSLSSFHFIIFVILGFNHQVLFIKNIGNILAKNMFPNFIPLKYFPVNIQL